jgi:formate dehydrogenase maturation protein FdhE
VVDFSHIVALCAELEGATIPPRVATRLANAFSRATEKLCVLAWHDHMDDAIRVNNTILRHAERGARDFVP